MSRDVFTHESIRYFRMMVESAERMAAGARHAIDPHDVAETLRAFVKLLDQEDAWEDQELRARAFAAADAMDKS